ncbi:hypothetical protein AAVH_14632 [Aphelenchoides avenae]|nr:hypothetical protein AAVH_14632 [Aphelenchus avenae]
MEEIVFGGLALKAWYVVIFGSWALQFAIMVSGLETAVWTTEDGYYWNYNGSIDTEYAEVSKYQVLGSFVAAALLHVGIFGFVVYKRTGARMKSSKAERNLLIQAALLTAYDVGTNALWACNILDQEAESSLFVSQVLWVFSSGINPLIYFSLNPRELQICIGRQWKTTQVAPSKFTNTNRQTVTNRKAGAMPSVGS